MPTRTLQISQTVQPGTPFVGSVNVGNNTRAEIDIDRTVPGGLNGLGTTTTVDIQFAWSSDNGVNWNSIAGSNWIGGIIVSPRTGQQLNTDNLVITDLPSGANRLRVTITVGGPSSVTLSGSVTVT